MSEQQERTFGGLLKSGFVFQDLPNVFEQDERSGWRILKENEALQGGLRAFRDQDESPGLRIPKEFEKRCKLPNIDGIDLDEIIEQERLKLSTQEEKQAKLASTYNNSPIKSILETMESILERLETMANTTNNFNISGSDQNIIIGSKNISGNQINGNGKQDVTMTNVGNTVNKKPEKTPLEGFVNLFNSLKAAFVNPFNWLMTAFVNLFNWLMATFVNLFNW